MKNYVYILSVIILALMGVGVAQAGGGPSNDNFAGAMPLVLNQGTVGVTTTNMDSSKETGEPDHAENAGGKSVWFKVTPAVTTVLRINTTDNAFDTLLAVYTGQSVNSLTRIGFNDDCHGGCGGASTVDLMVNGGTTYYIAVDGYNDNGNAGAGTFKIVLLDNGVPFQDDLLGAYNLGGTHSNSIAGTNYGAGRQAGEPEHINSVYPGAKSVWYRWTPTGTFGAFFELTENFNSQIAVYKSNTQAPTFANLTRVAWNVDSSGDSTTKYRVKFFAEQGTYYFISIAGHSQNAQAPDFGNFQLRYGPSRMPYSMDLDARNSKASISVYRPSEGNWYNIAALGNSAYGILRWGLNGDVPLAADFTGDGQTEETVVRNENGQKVWYIRTTPAPTIVQWGLASDRVVVGDFDGDSRADMTVIRNSAQGFLWYVRQSSNGALRVFNFGTTGDRPILGDFDGDGSTEVSVLRNTSGGLVWYILHSSAANNLPYTSWSAVQFGQAQDVAANEDFDGDGKTDIAVFRPSTGTWFILQSSNGQVRIDAFGLNGDKPQPADYNGDGKADLCVFRPSDGTWYIARPAGVPGQNYDALRWGTATDIPVTSLTTLSQ